MDFKSFKESVATQSKIFALSAKNFGKKTLVFTGKQLSTTPLFIETNDEYDAFLTEKRSIVVAYDDKQENIAEEMVLLMPLWSTQAFVDNATIRYMNEEKSKDVIASQ
jgi:hypothetical protein